MLKKTITYNDLDGNPITEDFWFHLSKGEMAEMALAKEGRAGGFDVWVKKMLDSQDGETLIATFKEILLSTIGQRSADNKYFDKTDEYTRRFAQSDAYSVLLMELLTDMDKMTAFINGVVPKDMQKQVEQAEAAQGIRQGEPNPSTPAQAPQGIRQGEPNPAAPKDDMPAWFTEGRTPTEAELKGAPPELIMEAFRRKSAGAGPVTQEQVPPQQ